MPKWCLMVLESKQEVIKNLLPVLYSQYRTFKGSVRFITNKNAQLLDLT